MGRDELGARRAAGRGSPRNGQSLKVSVGVGLSADALCVECGENIGPDSMVVGLYVGATEDLGFLDTLGQFCPECSGRFARRSAEGSTGPFDAGVEVDRRGAREAALRAAKRLRKLACDLENAEYRVE